MTDDILKKHPTPWRHVANETIIDASNHVVLYRNFNNESYQPHPDCLQFIVEAVNAYAEEVDNPYRNWTGNGP